jgi:PIN domain nuclease of toxin-antitoxin system
MRLLLDTHAFLWFMEGSARLSKSAKDHIEDQSHDLLLSIASLWEMAVKISLGKLDVPRPFAEFMQSHLALSSIGLLEINPQHTYAVPDLPFHHRDPFDRLLVAQCLSEGLTLISSDGVFEKYGVERVW